jgi:pyruvate formate lyase activating enzyme
MTGTVWDIRRYSLHDGPGIRTTVFLKGCPLTCSWCCNPESQAPVPEVTWIGERCLNCGACVESCPRDAITLDRSNRRRVDRARCDACGICAEQCQGGAMTLVGRSVNVDDVLREVAQDSIFYSRSGGGLTLSGGEPLSQPGFAAELLRRYKADFIGWHTTVETCGDAPWEDLALIVPHADLFLFDLKHMDASEHLRLTGAGNERILENLGRLAGSGADVRIRFPLVPGCNDDEQNIVRTARFVKSMLRLDRIDILPYHRLGEPKYRRLGRRYRLADVPAASNEDVLLARALFERFGLRVGVGG